MACLIKNFEYQTKLALSGISEFKFYSFVNSFVEKYNRFPELYEIPGANSSKHLIDTIHIKKNNSAKVTDILAATGTETILDANIKLNQTYSDNLIELIHLNETALVDITRKPSPYVNKSSEKYLIDEKPNMGAVFNLLFDKLTNLYGIQFTPITNKELALDKWKKVPDVLSSKAFIYNGNIYYNTDLADVDAPIHELTHLLLGSIRFRNPDLYFSLVELSRNFSSYNDIAKNYVNRTLSDIDEEVFVEEVAKYLAGKTSDITLLDSNILFEINLSILRLLDEALMGQYSVRSVQGLYLNTLRSLVDIVNSDILSLNTDDARVHRILANTKEELMNKGDLREDCE